MKMLQQLQHALLLIALLLAVACTEVDVCEEDIHPHCSDVTFNFDWKEFQSTPPDSLYVIAYRVINMWRSTIVVDRITHTGHFTVNPSMPEYADSTGIANFKLPGGDYKFITFNRSSAELTYDKVEMFLNSTTMTINELEVSYRTYQKNDKLLAATIPDWADYNPYSRFMQPNTNAICFDTLSTTRLYPNEQRQFSFHPHSVTQTVDIYFDINKVLVDNKFTVDSVFGEISGVPFTINLATGYIDIRRTCKMMYRCNLLHADGSPMENDTDDNKKVSCHGSISVPTVVQNQSPNVYTGPGIMQVVICCSTPNPDYPVYSELPRRKKSFQGLINLYNTLTKAELYRYTPDLRHVVSNGPKKALHIGTPLEVDGKMVLENSEDAGGVDVWKSTLKDTILIHI